MRRADREFKRRQQFLKDAEENTLFVRFKYVYFTSGIYSRKLSVFLFTQAPSPCYIPKRHVQQIQATC